MELKIVMDNKGSIQVEGPIHDRLLCYGLLEAAKDAIRVYEPGKIMLAKGIVGEPQ